MIVIKNFLSMSSLNDLYIPADGRVNSLDFAYYLFSIPFGVSKSTGFDWVRCGLITKLTPTAQAIETSHPAKISQTLEVLVKMRKS